MCWSHITCLFSFWSVLKLFRVFVIIMYWSHITCLFSSWSECIEIVSCVCDYNVLVTYYVFPSLKQSISLIQMGMKRILISHKSCICHPDTWQTSDYNLYSQTSTSVRHTAFVSVCWWGASTCDVSYSSCVSVLIGKLALACVNWLYSTAEHPHSSAEFDHLMCNSTLCAYLPHQFYPNTPVFFCACGDSCSCSGSLNFCKIMVVRWSGKLRRWLSYAISKVDNT